MLQGTTPTHTFNIPFSVSNIAEVRVIYSQQTDKTNKNSKFAPVFVKTNEDCVMEYKQIKVTLTQEDTFKFDHELPVKIQLRVLTNTNNALASVPRKIGITECLETEVIE